MTLAKDSQTSGQNYFVLLSARVFTEKNRWKILSSSGFNMNFGSAPVWEPVTLTHSTLLLLELPTGDCNRFSKYGVTVLLKR